MNKRLPAHVVLIPLLLASVDPARAVDFEVNDDSSLSLQGEFQYLYLLAERRLDDADDSLDEQPPNLSGDETVTRAREFRDNGSLIGIAGEHQLSAGWTAYFVAEWEYDADQSHRRLISGDSFIGLRGDFGELRLGDWDGIYQEAISDLLNPFEYEGISEFDSSAAHGDLLAWYSPDWRGFSIAMQTSLKGDGAGLDNDGDGQPDNIYPRVLLARYQAEHVSLQLGYDDRALEAVDAGRQLGLAASVALERLSLAAKLESIGDSEPGAEDGFLAWGLIGRYRLPWGDITLATQRIDWDREISTLREDRSEWLLGARYLISEQFYLYAEAARYARYRDHGDYLALGIALEF